jgi:hypothetical protein
LQHGRDLCCPVGFRSGAEVPDEWADHLAYGCGDPDVSVVAWIPAVGEIGRAHDGRAFDQMKPHVTGDHALAHRFFHRDSKLSERCAKRIRSVLGVGS